MFLIIISKEVNKNIIVIIGIEAAGTDVLTFKNGTFIIREDTHDSLNIRGRLSPQQRDGIGNIFKLGPSIVREIRKA